MTIRKIIATTATIAATLGAGLAIAPAAHAGTNEAKTCASSIAKIQVNKHTTSCAMGRATATKINGATLQYRNGHYVARVTSPVTHKTYTLRVEWTGGTNYYVSGSNGIELSITYR